MSKPVLYYADKTRGVTGLWMNAELGEPCELKEIDLFSGAGRSEDYIALNPMGKVPALEHEGVVITETAAICAYLADLYADKNLAPPLASPARGLYYRWMFFAPSCIEPTMLDKFGEVPREGKAAATAGHGDYERVVTTINYAIGHGPYLLGENFSAADVAFGSTLNMGVLFGAFEATGNISDYLKRLRDRPAFQATIGQAFSA